MTQLAVVHINAALPGYVLDIDVQGVALLNVVVKHCRKKVVRRTDGVEITCKVEVDILHRYDLSVAAARSAALYAEYGT